MFIAPWNLKRVYNFETEDPVPLKRILICAGPSLLKNLEAQDHPPLGKDIETKVMDFIADLISTEKHRELTSVLVLEFHQNVHRYARVDCWCGKRGKVEICTCIQGRFQPRRLKEKFYVGYGFKDLILEWTVKIERSWYVLRCTACTTACSCQQRFRRRLRNGQVILSDLCDPHLLEHITKGRRKCLATEKNSTSQCPSCKGVGMFYMDELLNEKTVVIE